MGVGGSGDGGSPRACQRRNHAWHWRWAVMALASMLATHPSCRAQPVQRVKVAMANVPGSRYATRGLRTLEFCQNCPDPHLEGSQLLALAPVHGPEEYKIQGILAICVPNHLGGKWVLNDVRGKVALVDRGIVPLVQKVLTAQAGGAVGVIIADDGARLLSPPARRPRLLLTRHPYWLPPCDQEPARRGTTVALLAAPTTAASLAATLPSGGAT